jgi:hypothetical protein
MVDEAPISFIGVPHNGLFLIQIVTNTLRALRVVRNHWRFDSRRGP